MPPHRIVTGKKIAGPDSSPPTARDMNETFRHYNEQGPEDGSGGREAQPCSTAKEPGAQKGEGPCKQSELVMGGQNSWSLKLCPMPSARLCQHTAVTSAPGSQ